MGGISRWRCGTLWIPSTSASSSHLSHLIFSRWKARWYRDTRTWHERVERMNESWTLLLPELIDAYITWHYPAEPPILHADGELPPESKATHTQFDSLNLPVFDLFTLATTVHVVRPQNASSEARCIVAAGYLGVSPLRPNLAISLKTLEHLRNIRRFEASYSIEAFARLLCYDYKVCWAPYK